MKKFLRNTLLLGLILAMGLIVGCGKDDVSKDTASNKDKQQEEHHDHAHDHHHDIPYEWSGIYEFKEGEHSIKFNKNEGDESILVSFISAEKNIKDIEHHAIHVMEAKPEEVKKGGKFVAENEYTYKLALNKEKAEFKFEVKKPGKYYVFTEHTPEEFDMEILDAKGAVLKADKTKEYEADHHDHDHDHKKEEK